MQARYFPDLKTVKKIGFDKYFADTEFLTDDRTQEAILDLLQQILDSNSQIAITDITQNERIATSMRQRSQKKLKMTAARLESELVKAQASLQEHRQVTSAAFAEVVGLVERVKLDCYSRIERAEKIPGQIPQTRPDDSADLSEVKL